MWLCCRTPTQVDALCGGDPVRAFAVFYVCCCSRWATRTRYVRLDYLFAVDYFFLSRFVWFFPFLLLLFFLHPLLFCVQGAGGSTEVWYSDKKTKERTTTSSRLILNDFPEHSSDRNPMLMESKRLQTATVMSNHIDEVIHTIVSRNANVARL